MPKKRPLSCVCPSREVALEAVRSRLPDRDEHPPHAGGAADSHWLLFEAMYQRVVHTAHDRSADSPRCPPPEPTRLPGFEHRSSAGAP
ncbi:MAG: hypothetical protein DWH91_18250 [Planctomycetota bacterium]|nr:MAG: hypothetical protein DWH91_18250 [Planctomycetota bacterium]